jgi:hypothetical protein
LFSLRLRAFEIVWDVSGGFGDDQKRMLNGARHRPVRAEGFCGCVLRQATNACDLFSDIDQPYANGPRCHSKNPDGLAFDVGAEQRVQAFAPSVVDIFAEGLLQRLKWRASPYHAMPRPRSACRWFALQLFSSNHIVPVPGR